MGHTNITTLNDIVDTLKLQFYPNSNTTSEEMEQYNSIVDTFVGLKEQAMDIKNHDNQKRFVNKEFANTKFRVMAVSQSSFNVVLQNGDISISLLRFATNHNNPLIKVEFRAEFLLRYGYRNAIDAVKKIINEFYTDYLVKVSEIHLAKDIQGYEFRPFDFYKIKSLSKSKSIYHNDISEQYSYGNRFTGFTIGKGDEMLRVYNKTVEITQKKEKAFIDVLKWQYNPEFDNTKNVWRLEFQLRRERLKELLSNDGLLDSLDNVVYSISTLWNYCVNRFVHKDLSDKQIFAQIQGYEYSNNEQSEFKILDAETLRKRFQRAELSPLWEQLQTFEDKQGATPQRIKDIKKPEKFYVENAYKALISTFVKLKRGGFCANELTEIIINAEKDMKDNHGVSIIDKARINALDYISKAKAFYDLTGVVEDGFAKYKRDMVNNLHDTFAIFENEPSSISTFQEFQKKFHNLDEDHLCK